MGFWNRRPLLTTALLLYHVPWSITRLWDPII